MSHDCFDVSSAVWRREGSRMYCSCGRLLYQAQLSDDEWTRLAWLLYEASEKQPAETKL